MEVRLEDVWFSYDGRRYVLTSVNLELKSNGLYIITGPNGSGKTTLLKILSLIYKPTRGRVIVDGRSYWDLEPSERELLRRDLVYVHDRPILLRGDVWYNLSLGLRLRNINSYDHLEELARRYGVSEFLKANVKSLSAGQRRIISILRALVLKPRVLVIDEPFNHLDGVKVGLLVEDLLALKESSKVVVATNYIPGGLEGEASEVYDLIAGSLRKRG